MTKRNRTLLRNCSVISIWLLAALLLLVSIPFPVAHADQDITSKTADAYSFPVKGGTKQWNHFKSHAEMLEACQIPNSILQNMSTSGLVETVLNYPLLGDMRAYNDLQQGFEYVTMGFNGLQELLKRNDAGTELMARYQNMNPTVIEQNWTALDQGNYATKFFFVETLLAQDDILKCMTELQQRDLLAKTLEKGKLKQEYPEVYGYCGQEHSGLLMGRVLRQLDAISFENQTSEDARLQSFLNSGSIASAEVLADITAQAELYLFGVTSRGYSSRWYFGKVYTPKNTAIDVFVDLPEMSEADKAWWDSYVAQNYPSATKLRRATQKYNCHSYAWYSQSSSNIRWMNKTGYVQINGQQVWMNGVENYWKDGSYVPGSGWKVGDKLHWYLSDHSGILSLVVPSSPYSNKVTSKWGAGPLMYHSLIYCPYWPGPQSISISEYKRAQ